MMVRVSVGMYYFPFPFFLPADFLAVVLVAFFAAAFGLAVLAAALRVVFFAADFLAAAFSAFASAFAAPRDRVSPFGRAVRGFSSTVPSSYPSAFDSLST